MVKGVQTVEDARRVVDAGADGVVVSNHGGRCHVPEAAAGLDPDVPQVHSYDYRSPADVPAGEVLVVGGATPLRSSPWSWPRRTR